MQASETKMIKFMSVNGIQFIIPIYQRNYDWGTKECKQLLDDILRAGIEKNINAHFIGSIVFTKDDLYTTSDINELMIIDGQQRLTTLTLIYIVLYRFYKYKKDHGKAQEIMETYLINKFANDEQRIKLKSIDNNDEAIKFLINENDPSDFNKYSKVIENYNFFYENINEENIDYIIIGLRKLMFVEISLDKTKDDPQRIFESLNSTGLDLSQADLIRNYILMDLDKNLQVDLYKNYWNEIENNARNEGRNESLVSDFIRDYLTLKNKKIPNKNRVYEEFKNKFREFKESLDSINELKINLEEIKRYSKMYNKLVNPDKEENSEIKRQLEYINRLEINVAFPFLLRVYDDYSKKIIDREIFIDILELVQSYVWRRFILGLPTNALNKIFMTLYEKINIKEYFYSIAYYLVTKGGAQRFPSNLEIKECLKYKDMYSINKKNIYYFFERLENHNNKELVDLKSSDVTIEHIFPKNPNEQWKKHLSSEEYDLMMNTYLNTVSNLTFSANNNSLSNKYFTEKRDMPDKGYKYSKLWLNEYISKQSKWGKKEVEFRYQVILKRFFEIWEYPDINFQLSDNEEVNIFEADDPTNKKIYSATFLEQKLDVKNITDLYINVVKTLYELNKEKFFTTELKEKIKLSLIKNNDFRKSANIDEKYCIESNLSSNDKFKRLKFALEIFDLDDELTVKYI